VYAFRKQPQGLSVYLRYQTVTGKGADKKRKQAFTWEKQIPVVLDAVDGLPCGRFDTVRHPDEASPLDTNKATLKPSSTAIDRGKRK
jgi:hypothetical protein